MNKKNILIMALVLTLVFALSGCSDSETNDIQIEKIESTSENETGTEENIDTERVIGENADLERVSGEISKIVGNYITLELYVEPERGANKAESESESGTTSPLTGTATAEGATPGSKGGGGGGGGQRAGTKTFEKSGEVVELVIPVGTVIKSFANPDMTFEIEALSKGMSINVFVDSELTDIEKANNPDSNIIYASSVNIIENN